MRARLKRNRREERRASQFNPTNINEVLIGDDSAPIHELEVYVEARARWMDLNTAFRARDVITDNFVTHFFEPTCEEDRRRGYTLP